MMLVDSEGPVSGASPWAHVKDRDGWVQPAGATDEDLHLMTECMESWFLADIVALQRFYGSGFKENALPANRQFESVSKKDVLKGLEHATRQTKTKGAYGKGEHSFRVMQEIDPQRVRKGPWAERFFASLERRLKTS